MLPPLPKTHKKQEADFGLRFRAWFKDNPRLFESGSFELKDTRGKDYLNFNEVKDAQVASALLSASDEGNLIRATVATPGTADYLYFRNSDAWVVIKYPKHAFVISMEAFVQEKKASKRASLLAYRAQEICTYII